MAQASRLCENKSHVAQASRLCDQTQAMRIVQLTPGTAHFYCGNCLRDSALGSALKNRGHDVTMTSLYLPVHTEDIAPPPQQVFIGGINMYLRHRSPLLAKALKPFEKALDKAGVLRWAAKRGDMTNAAANADLTVAMLEGDESKQLDDMLTFLAEHDKPDVVCLCNALLVGLAEPIKERVNVPVAMTMHGEDAFLDSLPEPFKARAWTAMRDKARHIDAFVGVSDYYARVMTDRMCLDPAKVHVVHNGVAKKRDTVPDRTRTALTIGYLAHMRHDKGLHHLIDAFIELAPRVPDNVTLEVLGVQLKQDKPYIKEQQRKLEKAGLLHRVTFIPNATAEEKHAFLDRISILSVPALYGEAFGLYLIEAMSHGVPAVQPDHAAFPEIIARTGGGILYDHTTPGAHADTLESLILDHEKRAELGRAGHHTVTTSMTDDHMAADFEAILKSLTASPASEHPVATPATT